MSILSVVQYVYHLLFPMLIFVMVHMELRNTVVMYSGSYDIGYAIPSLYHVCMDFNEGFTHSKKERERLFRNENSAVSSHSQTFLPCVSPIFHTEGLGMR